jgi:hypothetical protein
VEKAVADPNTLTTTARGVADVHMLDQGAAPEQAMAMTYVANANSIALVMSNAAMAQQRGQVLAAAALSKVLVLIIAAG